LHQRRRYSGGIAARAAARGSITVHCGVVDQHQDVRQLQFGTAPHLDARRQARDDGAFGGADQAGGRGGKVVVLQVQFQHQAAPRAAAHRALHIHRTFALDSRPCAR
jgi:hypothetical protein